MYKRSVIFYFITLSFSIYVILALLNSQFIFEATTSDSVLTIIASHSFKEDTTQKFDYSKSYSNQINKCLMKQSNETLTRAVVFYFPIGNVKTFEPEFKWMYQSWLEMLKYQSNNWRTDLVLFVDKFNISDHRLEFFSKLNCTFKSVRSTRSDHSMCTLLEFESISNRKYSSSVSNTSYDYLYTKFNIFEPSQKDLNNFYIMLKESLIHYSYTDSIMIAFDGYEYLKSKYDYLIRSDLDVFLTPGFAKWKPKKCNDFYVGRGGYSSKFNMKRLNRVANFIGLKYNFTANLGSTWYGTPENFRLVSYLTLLSMAYLSNEEFSKPEREGKLAARLWPDWHYGVLLLYGQHLTLNHLIRTKSINVIKLDNLMDVSSSSGNLSIFDVIHIHVYHGEKLFSKFEFKKHKYVNNSAIPADKKDHVNYYALRMALKSLKLVA